jgi:hypothetical protein
MMMRKKKRKKKTSLSQFLFSLNVLNQYLMCV